MGKKNRKNKKNNVKTNASDIKRLFKVLGLSLLIVFLFVAFVSFLTNDTSWNVFGKKKTQVDLPDGVISKIDADSVKSIRPYENGVVILTNSAVQYLDASGREIESNKHIYATPEMQTVSKNVFIYDKGGTACRIEKNTSVYREMTAQGTILCGAVGKKGNYAYSLDNHDGYQSHIFVYSFDGVKQFEWGSASDYCFRMALSDNGNRIAVCVVGVQNAEYYSKVMLFSFNSGQPLYTVDFTGKTVFDIDFVSGKTLAAYTDGGVYIIESDGQYSSVQQYTSSEISHSYVNPNGLSATAVIPYGNEQTPLISVFDANHRQMYTHQYNTLVSDVVCSDSHVGVVMYDKVEILNKSGKVIGDIFPGETCERCVIVSSNLFIITGTGLHRYNIHFDSDKAEQHSAYVPRISKDAQETTVPESTEGVATESDAEPVISELPEGLSETSGDSPAPETENEDVSDETEEYTSDEAEAPEEEVTEEILFG